MATITGTIIGGSLDGQEVSIEIPTVRIPELPENELPFDPDDKFPIYDISENKTVWSKASDVRGYILTGGDDTPVTPVLQGNDVEITVTVGMVGVDGNAQVPVPALEGKVFTLNRRNSGPLKTTEFNILPSGGFELTGGDIAMPGEVFFAHLYEYDRGGTGGGLAGAVSEFNGMAPITANITLNSVHRNKLIHIAGGASKITVTLESIEDAPLYSTIHLETLISNTYQSTIQTQGGQVIYFGNTSQTKIILGKSEYIKLFVGEDGYYVLGYSENILNVGQPLMDYVERLNTLTAKGQLVNRADYPRLWQWLTEHPQFLVTDDEWTDTMDADEEVYIYKGMFSEGNGTTDFRMPDHQEMTYTGIKNIAGSDSDRVPNDPGVIQRDMIKSHTHGIDTRVTLANQSGSATPCWAGSHDGETGAFGGSKTTPKNVGLIPLIRI